MTVSAWWLLPLAVPVLLLGELLVARVRWLAKFDMPVPVVGGFVVATIVLFVNLIGHRLEIGKNVTAPWWTWLTAAEPVWRLNKPSAVFLPFQTMFFTCVGLNASWAIARRGSWMLLILLITSGVLAVLQNLLGVSLAKLLGVPPAVGVLCGSLSLTGGPGTVAGFAETLTQRTGFGAASVVGTAAAMLGIVTGSLFGGPTGGQLIRRHKLNVPGVDPLEPIGASAAEKDASAPAKAKRGFVHQVMRFVSLGRIALVHVALLLICVKVGAWTSYAFKVLDIAVLRDLPAYIGAMMVAIVLRNVLDALGSKLLDTDVINLMGAITLGLFLAMAIAQLPLLQLKDLAGAMLVILAAQVVMMVLFAWWVTFNVMGRDYEAAVATAGHVGYGLGITPNAVATMDVLTSKFGIAPRAFLTVSIIGGFLIDPLNVLINTFWLNRL